MMDEHAALESEFGPMYSDLNVLLELANTAECLTEPLQADVRRFLDGHVNALDALIPPLQARLEILREDQAREVDKAFRARSALRHAQAVAKQLQSK